MQFINQNFIKTRYFRVQNQALSSHTNVDPYQGILLHDFDFGRQAKNFQIIKEKLAAKNIYPEYIFCSKKNYADTLVFVVTFSDPNVIWYRTQGAQVGSFSGQNKIILHRLKVNTSEFVKWDAERVDNLFASIEAENASS
jgi:hypothetical protein